MAYNSRSIGHPADNQTGNQLLCLETVQITFVMRLESNTRVDDACLLLVLCDYDGMLQARASVIPSCVLLLRVLKELRCREEKFACVPQWVSVKRVKI